MRNLRIPYLLSACVLSLGCLSCDSLDEFTIQDVIVHDDGTSTDDTPSTDSALARSTDTAEVMSTDTVATVSTDSATATGVIWTECNAAYDAMLEGNAAPGDACTFAPDTLCAFGIRYGTMTCVDNKLQVGCMTDTGEDTSWPPPEDRICFIE